MNFFVIIIVLVIQMSCLLAVELPADLSSSVAKAQKNYQRDMARALADLEKTLNKNRLKLIKSYKKIEKTLVKEGKVTGLSVLRRRLKWLQGKEPGSLFGGTTKENEPIVVEKYLPESAQKLENTYDKSVSNLVGDGLAAIKVARGKYIKDLGTESKRLLKKDLVAKAESLQIYIDALEDDDYVDELTPVTLIAHCISTMDISKVAPSNKSGNEPDNSPLAKDGWVSLFDHKTINIIPPMYRNIEGVSAEVKDEILTVKLKERKRIIIGNFENCERYRAFKVRFKLPSKVITQCWLRIKAPGSTDIMRIIIYSKLGVTTAKFTASYGNEGGTITLVHGDWYEFTLRWDGTIAKAFANGKPFGNNLPFPHQTIQFMTFDVSTGGGDGRVLQIHSVWGLLK